MFLLAATALVSADPITLKNKGLIVTVDPAIGRITEFRAPAGENLMCLDNPGFNLPKSGPSDYVARGGERLWPTPMFNWHWLSTDRKTPPQYAFLPDEAIDGEPWRVISSTALSVDMESETSTWLGVVASRRLTLDADAPVLRIETTLKRVRRNPIPVQAWSVAVVKNPEFCLLGIDKSWRKSSNAWTELSRPGRVPKTSIRNLGNSIEFTLPKNPDHPKVGAMGAWLAAIFPHEIFLQAVEFAPDDSYPDSSSVQAFAGDGFTEIETVSPNRFLKPGESLASHVVWQLLPRTDEGNLSDSLENRARELQSESRSQR